MIDKLIQEYDDNEEFLFVPNQIFIDLQKNLPTPHAAFAYSYYFLISYLYRYTKYGIYLYTQSDIKSILGYSPSNKKIDYIVKKAGVLDQLGYTESSTDYPVWWEWDGEPSFKLNSEIRQEFPIIKNEVGKNYKIKVPLKALYKDKESREEKYFDGTFYDKADTHKITIQSFLCAMQDHNIGAVGFYIYCYLKRMNKIHQKSGRYDVHSDKLASELKLSIGTLFKYLKPLDKDFLSIKHKTYGSGLVNSYITKEPKIKKGELSIEHIKIGLR